MPKIFPLNIDLSTIFTPTLFEHLFQSFFIIVIGFITIQIFTRIIIQLIKRRTTPQIVMITRKTLIYCGFILILVIVLRLNGFNLSALLGAAGIVGIAIGFASQTSMSNLISGLFLISEKPFELGDVLKVADKVGIVISIDLLSVKMRTFDNQYLRIPNEKILSSEITNITRFPIRRFDIKLRISFESDLTKVEEILKKTAEQNPYSLDEPEPFFLATGFTEYAQEVLFGLWFEKNDYVNLSNSIFRDIKEAFDREGIKMTYPHWNIHSIQERSDRAPKASRKKKAES